MTKALTVLAAFLYVSLAVSLGLSQTQAKANPPIVTVYQEPG
ncbi:MAG TPA: hypothetical protein VNT76_21345 [Candidatus Binatus sp.]|nr:hypothetical protein [Candidatus Binatus sp.]